MPGSKLLVLRMVIQPLIGNPYNGYINPYYWVDDHPLLYGNNVSLDPSTYEKTRVLQNTFPETNIAPEKLRVGRRSFPFGAQPGDPGAFAVGFREGDPNLMILVGS